MKIRANQSLSTRRLRHPGQNRSAPAQGRISSARRSAAALTHTPQGRGACPSRVFPLDFSLRMVYNVAVRGGLPKWGRLRAPPAAEEASKKEWQRSKSCERTANKRFRAPQQDITGRPRKQAVRSLPKPRENGDNFISLLISREGAHISGGLPKWS